MAENIKFYFTKDNVRKDLEVDFKKTIGDIVSNVKYLKCDGLEDFGKIKNKYVESFADSNSLVVYEDKESGVIYREPTDITFTLVFVGPQRQSVYDDFLKFVSSGIISYYDTKRCRTAELVMIEPVKPSEDEYIGSTPYMKAAFKFKNINGGTVLS